MQLFLFLLRYKVSLPDFGINEQIQGCEPGMDTIRSFKTFFSVSFFKFPVGLTHCILTSF